MREGGGAHMEREMGKWGGIDSWLVRRLFGESRLKYGTRGRKQKVFRMTLYPSSGGQAGGQEPWRSSVLHLEG